LEGSLVKFLREFLRMKQPQFRREQTKLGVLWIVRSTHVQDVPGIKGCEDVRMRFDGDVEETSCPMPPNSLLLHLATNFANCVLNNCNLLVADLKLRGKPGLELANNQAGGVGFSGGIPASRLLAQLTLSFSGDSYCQCRHIITCVLTLVLPRSAQANSMPEAPRAKATP
jgi:hypothetical protein